MNNTLMRRVLAALIVVLGLTAVHSIATAQPYVYTCIVVNGVKVIIIVNKNTANNSTGSGTFTATQPVPPTGPINAAFTPVNINVTAGNAATGQITTRLAPGPQPRTTIVSNNPRERFPATGVIAFNAEATLSSKPGVFKSATPLEFTSKNLTSTPPFSNETFTLSNNVEFTDADGTVAFTLEAGSTSVTLGQNNDNPPDDLN